MPWKPAHPNLPNNWSLAIERMVSKEKQLVKKGKLEAFNLEMKPRLTEKWSLSWIPRK